MIERLSVVTLVNDGALYSRMVESLKTQAEGVELQFLPISADAEGLNAAAGLDKGLDRADAEWVLCVHQDVRFPTGWLESFSDAVGRAAPETAVIGLVGCRGSGHYAGHVKDPHGHKRWGPLPASVVSVDELLIAVRRASGLRFDPECPGFMLYGTDICLSARERGLRSVVVDAPVVHLSGGRKDGDLARSEAWLLGKWGGEYNDVIPTCTALLCRRKARNFLKWALAKAIMRYDARSAAFDCGCGRVREAPTGTESGPR